jgi:vacuolar-type H+-ATPase subunit H
MKKAPVMSTNNLGQLINSLKTEAIDVAEMEAAKIIEQANMQAKQIVEEALDEKQQIINKAKIEGEGIVSKGGSALRQAARDVNISLRNDLLRTYKKVFETEVRKEFTPDLIKTAILKVVDSIEGDMELRVSEEFFEEVSEFTQSRLKSLKKLPTIVADDSIINGFSVVQKNQGWSYLISPEQVATALEKYLSKNWMNILKNEE